MHFSCLYQSNLSCRELFYVRLDLDLPDLHQDAKDLGFVWFAIKGHHATAYLPHHTFRHAFRLAHRDTTYHSLVHFCFHQLSKVWKMNRLSHLRRRPYMLLVNFLFPLYLIGDDHGLHISITWCVDFWTCSDVGISSGFTSTLKDACGLEIRQASLLQIEHRCFCLILAPRACIQTIVIILFM